MPNANTLTVNAGLFGAYLFGLSLFVSRSGMEIGMGISFLAFLVSVVREGGPGRLKEKSVGRYLAFLYFGGAAWNLFSAAHLSGTLNKLLEQYKLLTVLVLGYFITTRKRLVIFLVTAAVSLAVAVIWGIIQWWLKGEDRLQSFGGSMSFAHPLAMALVVMVPFIYYFMRNRENRIALFLSLVYLAGILNLVLTKTRGSWLAFIGGTLCFFLLTRRYKHILIFLGVIAVTVNFMPDSIEKRFYSIVRFEDASITYRINLWKAAVWTYSQNPVFGAGEENNHHWFTRYKEQTGQENFLTFNGNTHNMYLHYLSVNGLFIVFFLFFLFCHIPKRIRKVINRFSRESSDFNHALITGIGAGIAAFCISGLTQNVWYTLYASYSFFTLLFILEYLLIASEK